MRPSLKKYLSTMTNDNPLKGYAITMIGDCSGDPTEAFTHYDILAFWLAKKLIDIGKELKILDIGSRKIVNSLLSAQHNVTSIVLADCGDTTSRTKYAIHDVSDPLPFLDNSFDVFTSTATLHLIGLGRYGDRLNPNALPNLINELDRVMQPESHLIFSIQHGRETRLLFNNGWVLTLEKLKSLFSKWELSDHLITPHYSGGEYDLIFLHFKRNNHA